MYSFELEVWIGNNPTDSLPFIILLISMLIYWIQASNFESLDGAFSFLYTFGTNEKNSPKNESNSLPVEKLTGTDKNLNIQINPTSFSLKHADLQHEKVLTAPAWSQAGELAPPVTMLEQSIASKTYGIKSGATCFLKNKVKFFVGREVCRSGFYSMT